jgi:O-antigen ligase
MASLVSLMTDATLALIFCAVVVAFCRFRNLGLFAVLATFFVDTLVIGIPPAELAGFNLYPQDVLCTVLIVAALARLAFRRPTGLHLVLGLFAIIALFSLFTGYQQFGAKASFNEFRQVYFFIAVVFYFSSFEYSEASVRALKRAWYITAISLMVLAVYRWAAEWFGLPAMDTWAILRISSPSRITRTLYAAPTLFLFQAWLLTGPSVVRKRRRISQIASLILLAFVFLLQHRTVWVTAIVCVIYLFGRLRTVLNRPVWLVAGAVSVCAVALVVATADSSNPVVASLRYSISEPTSDRSTLEWRVTSWEQLLGDNASAASAQSPLLGYRPFGAGLRRRVDGSVVSVSAHNYYVETLMRMGMAGLAAVLVLFGMIFWKIRRNRCDDDTERQHWQLIVKSILVGQLVYAFGYGFSYEQGILLGASIGLALAQSQVTPAWRSRAPGYRRPVPVMPSSGLRPALDRGI